MKENERDLEITCMLLGINCVHFSFFLRNNWPFSLWLYARPPHTHKRKITLRFEWMTPMTDNQQTEVCALLQPKFWGLALSHCSPFRQGGWGWGPNRIHRSILITPSENRLVSDLEPGTRSDPMPRLQYHLLLNSKPSTTNTKECKNNVSFQITC